MLGMRCKVFQFQNYLELLPKLFGSLALIGVASVNKLLHTYIWMRGKCSTAC